MTADTTHADLFYSLAWDDPYPDYRRLVDLGPVRWLDRSTVLVTGFDACLAVLHDRLASNDLRLERSGGDPRGGGSATLDRFDSFLYRDPPDHARIRRVVLTVLRDHSVEASGEVAARAAARLLDAMVPGQPMDAVSQLAQRLPAAVSRHMFGLEERDVPSVAG